MYITPYLLAERFIGTKEIPGNKDNPQILAMLRLDQAWPENDEVPWCSAFMNYICWLLRLPRSKSLRARSWLDVGMPMLIGDAKVGFDVVVLNRPEAGPNAGHVGWYAGGGNNTIFLLSGNVSNKVAVTPFSVTRVIGVKRLQ
jgi:uncharacterized protein (TIGR02594 family)